VTPVRRRARSSLMTRYVVITCVLLLGLWFGTAACLAAGTGGTGGRESEARWTLWAVPPAIEVVDNPAGYHSVEIGATPAFWTPTGGSEGLFGARLGVFFYPNGGSRGLAIYAGFGDDGNEVGLWYVWRSPPGASSPGDTRSLSFRIGLGSVRGTVADRTSPGAFGLGLGLGFAF
jgi:hypothetical protein